MCSLQLPFPLASNITKKPLFPDHTHLRLRLAWRQKCAISETKNGEGNPIELPSGLKQELMPKHVAVIMDGNRRWAKNRGLSVHDGHKAGGKAFEQLSKNCYKYGVKVLTVFAFSTENWNRQKEEVDFLMKGVFTEFIPSEVKRLREAEPQYDVRLSFMGNRRQLGGELQKKMAEAEERTKHRKKMHVVVAIDYGGRSDITEAARKITTKVKHGVLQVEEVDDAVFQQHLGTNVIDDDEFQNPDLMIRSSGELRVSNFMLWQMAHTEMFFTNKMFPDFDDADFIEAITAFQHTHQFRSSIS